MELPARPFDRQIFAVVPAILTSGRNIAPHRRDGAAMPTFIIGPTAGGAVGRMVERTLEQSRRNRYVELGERCIWIGITFRNGRAGPKRDNQDKAFGLRCER